MKFKIKDSESLKKTKKVSIGTQLEGDALEKFRKLAEANGISNSELLKQMVAFCLGQVDWKKGENK